MTLSENFEIAEIQLIYTSSVKIADLPCVTNSEKAHFIFRDRWSEQIGLLEEFNMLLLNRAHRVTGFINLSKGGVSATIVDLKIAFAAALKSCSSALILAHNHPSGAPRSVPP